MSLLDSALNDPLRLKYNLNVLFGNIEKIPYSEGFTKWSVPDNHQSDDDIRKLYNNLKDNNKNYGFVTGHEGLADFDFDWLWPYLRAKEHFGERLDTHTLRTPNGGARVLIFTDKVNHPEKYKESLKTELHFKKYVACHGEAKRNDGTIGEYTIIKDAEIRKDPTLAADLAKFFEELLEGQYNFIKYKCIKEKLPNKKNHLTHEQRLAISNFMCHNGIEKKAAAQFFSMCPDYDQEYSEGQIETTQKKIESGDLNYPPCDSLRTDFGFDEGQCKGCPRKKEMRGKKKGDAKLPQELPPIPQEEIDPTPVTINEVIAGYKTNIHIDEDINISIPLAFSVANFAACDSDVLGIIAPSGSGKTEVIRALGDTENQYIYPLSSLTSHTFVSGLKDSRDLAPQLRDRLVCIKDFTTILSKNKDEVSGIFADLRDVTDGYIQKTYGSEVGKKEYRNIHSSVLFACTNAIEKYYSVNSILGQRLIYYRPKNDPRQARIKAMQNAGKEKEIRETHHSLVMRLMNTVLTTRKERLEQLTHNIPADMQERIGMLCEFLAIVRTHTRCSYISPAIGHSKIY